MIPNKYRILMISLWRLTKSWDTSNQIWLPLMKLFMRSTWYLRIMRSDVCSTHCRRENCFKLRKFKIKNSKNLNFLNMSTQSSIPQNSLRRCHRNSHTQWILIRISKFQTVIKLSLWSTILRMVLSLTLINGLLIKDPNDDEQEETVFFDEEGQVISKNVG